MKAFNGLMIVISGVTLFITGCGQKGGQSFKPSVDTVVISGMEFHPAVLYVNKWDTVVWLNKDLVVHDITAYPNKEWHSDSVASNGMWKKEVGKNLDYFCSIHPTMKGKIEIRDEK